MNKLLNGIGVLGMGVTLAACAPADSENTMRIMKCYGPDKIVPSEILEIEKASRLKVKQLCGGLIVVVDRDPKSILTQTVDFIVVEGADGERVTIKQSIEKLLIPEKEAETQEIQKEPDTKYKLR